MRISVFAFIFLFPFLFASSSAMAQMQWCDAGMIVAAYKNAVEKKAIGDEQEAFLRFLPLAQIGIAPAQRHVADYLQKQTDDPTALVNAIMWAQLSAWGGDVQARKTIRRMGQTLPLSVRQNALDLAKNWTPIPVECGGSDAEGENLQVVSGVAVYKQEQVSDDLFKVMVEKLGRAIELNPSLVGQFSNFIKWLPAVEIVAGEYSDRLIFWDPQANRLKVSAQYVFDKKDSHLSYGLTLSVQRSIYDQMPDMGFFDPLQRTLNGTQYIGSLYGDVKSKRFFDIFEKTYKLVDRLPKGVQAAISEISYVYYMPPSRYHQRRLSKKSTILEYDYKSSHPPRYIVRVYRRLVLEKPEEVLLDLVKVAAQIQQHKAVLKHQELIGQQGQEKALQRILQGKMDGLQGLMGMNGHKEEKIRDIVKGWEENGPSGHVDLICETAKAQAQVAAVLKIGKLEVNRMINLKACPQARKLYEKRK